jgi:formylglycine-generating enzyme required for sulfatase activity
LLLFVFIHKIKFKSKKLEKMELKRITRLICLAMVFLLGLSSSNLKANNLNIGTPTVVGPNLEFTISWDNSWNTNVTPANWDGVWVFIKRQGCLDNLWTHALVSTVSGDHSVTGGVLQVDAVPDGMGVFIRRAAIGNGNIATATVLIALQTAADLNDNFQVAGIEMVYIPQGDFLIGDNGNGFGQGSGTNSWGFKNVLITNAIQTAGIGNAGNYKGNSSIGSSTPLPSTYPLGWNSFYSMKYEISQEQYVSFLNSLTYTQQITRTNVSPASAVGTYPIANAGAPARNGIKIRTSGVAAITPAVYGCDLNNNGVFNEAADGQNIACGWMAWSDLMAYLDWAALRPMTEFEYEKICRGASPSSLPGEYAWNAVTITQATANSLNNAGQASETATAAGNGLCNFNGGANAGPLRCGFAAGTATNKAQAGGAWFGAMEMSGNVWEQCVGGYNFNYSAFTSACGNGTLTAAGTADTPNWPVAGGGQGGGVLRGGSYAENALQQRISDCVQMTNNANQNRNNPNVGGRGVR